MKQKFLKTMLLLCALIVGSGKMWGAETTTTFQSGTWSAGMTLPCSSGGLSWVTSAKPSSFESSSPYRGIQYSKVSSDLTTTITGATITKIVVVASTNADANVNNIKVYVGDEQIGSTQDMPKENNQTYTFETSGKTGEIKVSVYNNGTKSTYVKSIAVTYTTYTITAQSNNDSYGTVSLSGNVITATPAAGYTYASPAYTVTSGTATVSQSGNDFTVSTTADCTVRINFEAIPPVSEISLPSSIALSMDNPTHQLTATVLPAKANQTVTWESSDESVATVSSTGLVTAVALGTATITATATNGTDGTGDDKTATCTVNVNPDYRNINFVTGNEGGDWSASPAIAAQGTEVTVSYSGEHKVKSFELLKNQPLTETIPTNQDGKLTYTGDNVIITVPGVSAKDGGANMENGNSMTISTTNGRNITSVVLTIAWFSQNAGWLTASSGTCTVSGSGNGTTFVTVSDINATSVTITNNCSSYAPLFVSPVEVHYGSLVSTDIAVSNTGNDYTFTMPNYDVEVSTSMWYKLSATADNSTLVEKKDVFLDRTLQAKGNESKAWNTFCAPFNATIPSGWTVKELSSTAFDSSNGTLTLNFSDAASIEAGKPYLVQVDAAVVDPTFENVDQNWTADPVTQGDVTFVPVLNPTQLTGPDKTKLYLSGENTLYYPSTNMTINGFRAYFQLNGLTAGEPSSSGSARSFVLNLGDGEQTGVTDNKRETINNNRWFTVDGVRVEGQPTRKGVYIVNGRKVVIK